uniref:Uncharacterized protein n=1 Tax=Pararge aegeria TaxID=116150 RepID=S4PX54_9NEOP
MLHSALLIRNTICMFGFNRPGQSVNGVSSICQYGPATLSYFELSGEVVRLNLARTIVFITTGAQSAFEQNSTHCLTFSVSISLTVFTK